LREGQGFLKISVSAIVEIAHGIDTSTLGAIGGVIDGVNPQFLSPALSEEADERQYKFNT